MKIRCGFVSNSSSSSFLIKYPLKTFSLKDTEKILDKYSDCVPEEVRGIFDYYVWRHQPSYQDISVYECTFKGDKRERDECGSCVFSSNYLYKGFDTGDCENINCKYLKKLDNKEYIEKIFENQYEYASDEQINNPVGGFWKDLKTLKETIDPKKETLKIIEVDSSEEDEAVYLSWDDRYKIRDYSEKLFKTHRNIIEYEG